MQLKLILFALAFVVGVKIVSTGDDDDGNNDGDHSKAFKAIQKCTNEFSVPREDVKGIFTGNFTEVTDNIQCFVKCVLIGNNDMNGEDMQPQVIIGKFLELFSRESKKPAQKCEEITEETPCEKAYSIFKTCLRPKQ